MINTPTTPATDALSNCDISPEIHPTIIARASASDLSQNIHVVFVVDHAYGDTHAFSGWTRKQAVREFAGYVRAEHKDWLIGAAGDRLDDDDHIMELYSDRLGDVTISTANLPPRMESAPDCKANFDDDRRAAAELEFMNYDFGDLIIAESSGWAYITPGVEMNRPIYLEEPAATANFIVVFASPDSTQIVDAYAISHSGNLFGKRGPHAL